MPLPTDGFGSRLSAIREERGWSQNDLATRLGYHKTWVSKLERGERSSENLTVRDLFRLAYVLGVSPWALISGWEPDRPVDLDLDGVDKTTAGEVWAWANWEALPPGATGGFEESALYLRFSPDYQPGFAEEVADLFRRALGRPVEVDTEDEGVTTEYEVDPLMEEVLTEFRTAVDRIAARFAEAKEKR